MSFGIALTGIEAAQSDLDVVSNNIANADTTGFKQSVTEFSDLYASAQNGVAADAIGNGVQVAAVAQDFSQGSIETTGNNLNLAMSGQGFFVVSNGGALSYTRSGDFSTNSDGDVVNPQGHQHHHRAADLHRRQRAGGDDDRQYDARPAGQCRSTGGCSIQPYRCQ
jgi:flagellar hook protein FlgE